MFQFILAFFCISINLINYILICSIITILFIVLLATFFNTSVDYLFELTNIKEPYPRKKLVKNDLPVFYIFTINNTVAIIIRINLYVKKPIIATGINNFVENVYKLYTLSTLFVSILFFSKYFFESLGALERAHNSRINLGIIESTATVIYPR